MFKYKMRKKCYILSEETEYYEFNVDYIKRKTASLSICCDVFVYHLSK